LKVTHGKIPPFPHGGISTMTFERKNMKKVQSQKENAELEFKGNVKIKCVRSTGKFWRMHGRGENMGGGWSLGR
jgi:hypothetical protein